MNEINAFIFGALLEANENNLISFAIHSSERRISPCFQVAPHKKSLKFDFHALIPDEKCAKIVGKSAEQSSHQDCARTKLAFGD